MLYAICFSLGFVLWAMSTGWLAFAGLAIGHVAMKGKLHFGPAYWSMIFPSVRLSAFIFYRVTADEFL